ncbi:hypothetical protein GCM10009007_20880 [Formosimonas limnophila]|uniref:Uncharacterized protein n=1 Tax=Formosimonas limnophila TaxID=1384487 RepID=A0A8J3G107_9BURK|nr:hypothetical protein [Formosimonas limnophila]GHA79780.1 hypothetical protein GCM10009007_20880 [Formosimonas limnophila]
MKKAVMAFVMLLSSVFLANSVAFADDVKIQEPTPVTAAAPATSSIFEMGKQAAAQSPEACAQAQLLSQAELDDTKGAAPRSYTYTCVTCGARHGGVYSPYYCFNCWGKR